MLSNLKSFTCKVLLLFTLVFSNAISQQVQQQNYTIAGVSVEGNKFADEATIITLSSLKPGDNISLPGDNKLNVAIRNLWARKQFSEIELKIDKITPVGVFLIIKVKEFDRLNSIITENNKKLDVGDIKKAFGKTRGDIISPWDLYVAKRDIKKAYADEGLIFAKVEMEKIKTDTPYYANVKVIANEGVQFYVEKIEFVGNKHYEGDELAGVFDDTHTKKWWQFWRSSKFDVKEFEKDKKKLNDFFKREGFIDGHIVKDTALFDEAREKVVLRVTVDEGQKYYVRNISVEGNTVFPSELILKRVDFKKGEVYDQEKLQRNITVNEDFNDALSLYNDNGYISAEFVKDEIRVTDDSVDVILRVREGSRVTIRRVEIAGNSKTKDKVIRRELYTRPGDYFSRSAVLRSIRGLGVLNYFTPESLMKFEVKPVDETKVDLVYNVVEHSTETFNASIGFAGTYGITGSVGMSFNNFSITEPLKGGAGQVFNFNWEIGQASRYKSLSIGFTEPWLFNDPTTVGFNIFDTRYNYVWNFRQTGIAVNFGRRLKWPDDYFRIDWNVRVKENNVGEESASGLNYRSGRYTEVTFGQTISRISLNNTFFPTSGSRFALSFAWAAGAVNLGSTDYFKTGLKYEFNQPLLQIDGVDKLVLYLSTDLGYIEGFKSDTAISPIELYKMGGNGLGTFGVTPLRGYEDEAIGPKNGGRVSSKHVAELRFAISQEKMPIYVYLFAEAGNVWKNLSQTDPFDLKRSAGVGVQLMMAPIGVIGFSYGYGFDKSDITSKVSGWKFLFHLGNN
jgi:outer membrane protein insertion porin family